MNILLTTAGQAAVASSLPAPPTFVEFRLGDGFNYLPAVGQTALTGTTVFTGVPGEAQIIGNNLLKYTLTLDATVGPFNFGEVGLYLPGNVLAAVGAASTLVPKTATAGAVLGNTIVVDCYLSTVGTDYAIYAELGNSNYPMNLSAIPNVDTLPAAAQAFPNIFMVSSPDNVGSLIAHSNNALWSFQGYEEQVSSGFVVTASSLSIDCNVAMPSPFYLGELLVQFTSGANVGVVRRISGYNSVGNQYVFGTALSAIPIVNDTFIVLKRTILQSHVSNLLNGLNPLLTSGNVNDLLTIPLTSLVKQDGTTPMTGLFDFGGLRAINLADPVLVTDAVNKNYLDTSLTGVSSSLTSLTTTVAAINTSYVRHDGTIAMTGSFNFGGFRGVNLATPTASGDATTKAYVDAAVSALSGSIVTVHNSLTGLQGGSASERYHLTASQHTFLTGFALTGFPTASYVNQGIVELADSTETGAGALVDKAVTPEALVGALNAVGANALKTAVQTVASSVGGVQHGAGIPTGITPTTPAFYVDTTTNARSLHIYDGAWFNITEDASTTVIGRVRLATTAEATALTLNTVAVTPSTLYDVLGATPSFHSVLPAQIATLVNRQVVRFDAGNYAAAQATGLTPDKLAVGVVDTANSRIITSGVVTGFAGLVTDSEYYLSDVTAGAITNIAPTDTVKIGVARSATELYLDIDVGTGGGDATAAEKLEEEIIQAAHGFVVGDWLYHNGTTLVKALGDADATSDVVGLVSTVTDASTFKLMRSGYVTGLAGLTAGASMRLSTTVAGALQSAIPTTSGHVDKPLLLADSTTSGWVQILRGAVVTAPSPYLLPVASAAGAADVITADFTPNVSLTNGISVLVRAATANLTTTPTFSPDGLTAKVIVKGNNLALAAGDIAGAGHWLELNYDATLDRWVLQNPASGVLKTPVISGETNLTVRNSAVTPNTQLTITASDIVLRDSNNDPKIVFGVNLTADILSSGINGLDFGVVSNNNWYYTWVINNGSTMASLISLSSTSPTLPPGYSYKHLVSATYYTTSFRKYVQLGRKIQATEVWPALLGGSSTVTTLVSPTTLLPPIHKELTLFISHATAPIGGQSNSNVFLDSSALVVVGGAVALSADGNSRGAYGFCSFVPRNPQQYYYNVTNGSSNHNLIAFEI